jgi:GNAT superfamily N-acetyltransferase
VARSAPLVDPHGTGPLVQRAGPVRPDVPLVRCRLSARASRDGSRLTQGIKVRDVSEGQGDSEAVTVLRIAEAEIDEDLSRQLQSLLQACFSGYPNRSYFKLPPHFRYIATRSDGVVAAQMGVELRAIRAGDLVLRTFGVVDLCVGGSERSRGLASMLLAEVTEFARACAMAFVILFADDGRLYARNGWTHVSNRCTWVKIDNHTTLGLTSRVDPGVMMVKAVGNQAWPADDVDLLGHLFLRSGAAGPRRPACSLPLM